MRKGIIKRNITGDIKGTIKGIIKNSNSQDEDNY